MHAVLETKFHPLPRSGQKWPIGRRRPRLGAARKNLFEVKLIFVGKINAL
jgi:hypothetical protein